MARCYAQNIEPAAPYSKSVTRGPASAVLDTAIGKSAGGIDQQIVHREIPRRALTVPNHLIRSSTGALNGREKIWCVYSAGRAGPFHA